MRSKLSLDKKPRKQFVKFFTISYPFDAQTSSGIQSTAPLNPMTSSVERFRFDRTPGIRGRVCR